MGQLRIIAGRLKGRRIDVPPGGGVRPTSDKAREALFSILGESVCGARVLDAYAGSGALGLEALSRGAQSVVFVEGDRGVSVALAVTLDRLGESDSCEVAAGDPSRWLATRPDRRFHLILADPPYAGDAEGFLAEAAGHLESGGRVVLEREVGQDPPACPDLRLERSGRYGRCRLHFYRSDG